MLRTTKTMKDKYKEIQNYLFDLIPEKWDEIYLYASVIDVPNDDPTGEMFFYYLPKSLIKKKPVNVYEVPKKFNIEEEEYLKIIEKLYDVIRELRNDFKKTDQTLWTNITISIADSKFKIEYKYDKISQEEYACYVRHVIWRYNYLHIGGEIKDERKIIEKYLQKKENKIFPVNEVETYETNMLIRKSNDMNTIVGFDREILAEQERQKEQKLKEKELEKKKKAKEQRRLQKEEEKRLKDEKNNKNQILS